MEERNNFPLWLLVIVLSVVVWSGVCPFDRGVWLVEITSVLIGLAGLIFTCKIFRFSNMAYFIITLWLIMHSIGAKYSFELVPFDWVTNLFGFERNHYDRLAHFVVGMNAYGFAEFVLRKGYVKNKIIAAMGGVLFIMAIGNAWELIEWLYAEIDGGKVGAAFLGSQGDIWDAQKDMLCDTLGAIVASLLFLCIYNKKGAIK